MEEKEILAEVFAWQFKAMQSFHSEVSETCLEKEFSKHKSLSQIADLMRSKYHI